MTSTDEVFGKRTAAAGLSITPQAVSKRVAALEKELGVQLFTRDARGARLTIDGQAFLPHARTFLHSAERAVASVRPGHRALRVGVIGRQLSLAGLLRGFHRTHPEIELDVVTLFDSDTAIAAVRDGTIDATFRAVTMPGRQLPRGVEATSVFDEPLHLFTGPRHEFAKAPALTPAQLAGRRIWMPGNLPGTEWTAYPSLTPLGETPRGGGGGAGGALRRAAAGVAHLRNRRPPHRTPRVTARPRGPCPRGRSAGRAARRGCPGPGSRRR